MKTIKVGNQFEAPSIIAGCMRYGWSLQDPKKVNEMIHSAMDLGINFFDHADIYGSEAIFGQALKMDASLKREDMILQSKCGIKKGMYDLSKDHILTSVDEILERLQTDYLDILLLHRPDALVEPEEVAEAFDLLETSGKVRKFGVSNHKPAQIELLKKYVKQPLLINQMQMSLPVSNMIANGMEVNMDTPGSIDHDDNVLDYSRLHDMTIQVWSPLQLPNWQGNFIGSDKCPALNAKLEEIAAAHGVSPSVIAIAWILRHPAKMQVVTGTTSPAHLKEMAEATKIELTRKEWYDLYLAAGHPLP